MPGLLVVNADDLGASDGVNAGIAQAHTDGIVTSASLMVDRPAAKGAADLARQLRRLSVGLHFEHAAGRDLDDPATLAAELQRQLAGFRDLAGADPTHLDSHHHVHLEGDRLAAFTALARALSIPVRGQADINLIRGFWGQNEDRTTDLAGVSPANLHRLVREDVREGWNELFCHPASRIDDLRSSYTTERLVELETLTSPGLLDELANLGIELRSFADWS